MQYKLDGDNIIEVDSGKHIPKDPLNKDYIEYLNWVTAGNPEADVLINTIEPDPAIQSKETIRDRIVNLISTNADEKQIAMDMLNSLLGIKK